MNDLRYAVRLLRRSRLFTTTVILTVAIGIGSTTTIFSVVNAVLLRPLPFGEPERLMQVAEKNDKLNVPNFSASALNYLSWKERTQSFQGLSAIGFGTYTLSGQGDPENYTGNTISPSLLPLLGIGPVIGRGFVDGDDRPGAAPVVMIGESLWRRRFGADRSAVGRVATINGIAYTIVGVAPRAMSILTTGDIFVPLVIDPPKEVRLNHVLFIVGRLKPGVTYPAAQSEMDRIATEVGRQYPEVKDWGISLVTFRDTFVGSQLRTALLVLLGAVVLVLLIVSANVANLLLARAIDRQKEMALRAALGARRTRLLRQLLIESVVLSVIGGAAGLLTAAWSAGALEAALPANVLPVPDIGLDRTVVLFAVGVTLVTGLVFGLAPAWQSSRTDVNSVLKEAGRSSTGAAHPLFRQALAAGELALATVLLIGATLLVRSLVQLQRVPLGFDPDGVMTLQLSLPTTKYNGVRRVAFYRELGAALKAIPGVQSAGISSGIPFGAGNYTQSPFTVTGKSALPAGASVPVDWRTAGPGYFATVRIPLLRGRDFTDADTPDAPPVMIVSRSVAKTFWGDDEPIGRSVKRVADGKEFTVIGIVGDVRSTTLNRESPALYYSAGDRTWPLMDIVVRPAGDAASVVSAVRQKVREMDAGLPLSNVRPMREWVNGSAAQPRLNAALLGTFAVVALLVAAIGTYGVLAYSVSRRTRELGLRMALGADRGGVVRLVVREGMTLGVLGIAIGVVAALVMGRLVDALVYGVSVWDPATYAAVAAMLTAVTFVACAIPALRASRVDPMVALRAD